MRGAPRIGGLAWEGGPGRAGCGSTDLHRVAGRCMFIGVMSKTGEPTPPELMRLVCQELAHGDRVRFAVAGGSMTPFIRHGDVVEIAPLSGGVEVGDVVLARATPERTVLHRVVRARGGAVWLRGDAQLRSEGPYSSKHVLGRAASVTRRGRLRDGWWRRVAGRAWVALHPLGPLMVRGVRTLCGAVRGGSGGPA